MFVPPVSIKTSSARDIDALLIDLTTGGDVRRETAIARLTVLGTRAVDRLAALVESDAPVEARQAALRALEAIDGSSKYRRAAPRALTIVKAQWP